MAAVSPWPLDAGLLLDLVEDPGDERLVTPMRSGPPKRRPLDDVSVSTLSGSLLLTAEDLDLLLSWGETTLSKWCYEFSWSHPRTGELRTMAFAQVPRARRHSVGGETEDLYTLPVVIEVLP